MWNFLISFLFDSLDMYRAIMCAQNSLEFIQCYGKQTCRERQENKVPPGSAQYTLQNATCQTFCDQQGDTKLSMWNFRIDFLFDTLDNYRGNYMGGQNSLSVLSVFMEERQKEREGAGILPICVCNIRCFPWSCNGASSTVWMQNSLSEGEAILPSLAWTITRPGHDVILIRVSQQICSLQTLVRR